MTGGSTSSSTLSSFSQSPANSLRCSSNSFSSEADVTSFVPFLWEEKPGVSKLETRKVGGKTNGRYVLSSDKTDPTVNTLLIPMGDNSSVFPPLRPPPRLQKSSKFDPPHHNTDNKLSGARANVISQSISRRRQHRRSKSEEDPFWLAMKVCSNEGTGNFDLVRRGMKDTATHLKEKDQRSLDFLFSFKVPVNRENRSAKKSVRTRSQQTHAHQSSGRRVAIPTFHGKGGQIMADAEVSWKSGEIPNGVLGLKTLQSSTNRLCRHSFDREREEFESTAYADGKKGFRITVQAKQYPPQPVELSCGLRMKVKQSSNKQFLPDLLNCKSINLFINSVKDPSIYRVGRVSSR